MSCKMPPPLLGTTGNFRWSGGAIVLGQNSTRMNPCFAAEWTKN
jgi:hypothetical protein